MMPGHRPRFSAEDFAAFTDARIAALKSGLQLKPTQEKKWFALETVLREEAKTHAARAAELREKAEEPQRKNTVHKVISLCGWLRVGEHRKYLERVKYISASFVELVTLLDRREKDLSSEDRARIMTVRPIFDELVAADVVVLDGARNIRLPVPGHTLAIVSGLTIFCRQLIEFIRTSA